MIRSALFLLLAAMFFAPAALSQSSTILLIDDDNGRTDPSNNKPYHEYTTDGLERFGLPYKIWRVTDSTSRRRPDSTTLNGYDLVIWDQPDYWAYYTTNNMTPDDTVQFGAYLAQGGKLWLNAPDYMWWFLLIGENICPSWTRVVSYQWVNESVAIDSLIGQPGDLVADGLAIKADNAVHLEGDYTDRLLPDSSAGAFGSLSGGAGEVNWHTIDGDYYAAVGYHDPGTGEQLYYMSSAFQGITSQASRDTLMARLLTWFGFSLGGNNDAAVTAINLPGAMSPASDSVDIMASVRCNTSETIFNAWTYAVVESLPGHQVYSDSVLLDSIPGTTTVQVYFPKWWTGPVLDTFLVTVTVSVPGDINPDNDQKTKTVVTINSIFTENFENGPGNWVGDWLITDEYAYSGSFSFADRPYADYPLNSDLCSILDTTFDLSGYSQASLIFSNRHWLEPGYDFGIVMASGDGGSTWDSLCFASGWGGADTVWHWENVDLSPYLGSAAFKFGLRLGSDPLVNWKGWYIDDLFLSASPGKEEMGAEGSPEGSGLRDRLVSFGPNPFSSRATVRYQVSKPGTPVSVKVYNLAGQMIRELAVGAAAAGDHSVAWDGRGADGRRVSAGVYFVRLNIGGQAATARLAVLR